MKKKSDAGLALLQLNSGYGARELQNGKW